MQSLEDEIEKERLILARTMLREQEINWSLVVPYPDFPKIFDKDEIKGVKPANAPKRHPDGEGPGAADAPGRVESCLIRRFVVRRAVRLFCARATEDFHLFCPGGVGDC